MPEGEAGLAEADAAATLQRRNELLAVFFYQSPESGEKRIQKLCDLAEK